MIEFENLVLSLLHKDYTDLDVEIAICVACETWGFPLVAERDVSGEFMFYTQNIPSEIGMPFYSYDGTYWDEVNYHLWTFYTPK